MVNKDYWKDEFEVWMRVAEENQQTEVENKFPSLGIVFDSHFTGCWLLWVADGCSICASERHLGTEASYF